MNGQADEWRPASWPRVVILGLVGLIALGTLGGGAMMMPTDTVQAPAQAVAIEAPARLQAPDVAIEGVGEAALSATALTVLTVEEAAKKEALVERESFGCMRPYKSAELFESLLYYEFPNEPGWGYGWVWEIDGETPLRWVKLPISAWPGVLAEGRFYKSGAQIGACYLP